MTRHAADELDRVHVGSLLADLIARLDAAPRSEALSPLVSACEAAIEAALAAADDRPVEPAPPTKSELAVLLESLMTCSRRDTTGVLRQLRRALGRLDQRPA